MAGMTRSALYGVGVQDKAGMDEIVKADQAKQFAEAEAAERAKMENVAVSAFMSGKASYEDVLNSGLISKEKLDSTVTALKGLENRGSIEPAGNGSGSTFAGANVPVGQ